jgi:hypothetical protein
MPAATGLGLGRVIAPGEQPSTLNESRGENPPQVIVLSLMDREGHTTSGSLLSWALWKLASERD